jgi:hypothetical protein
MPRMQILTAAEQQAFDTPPVFSGTQRETFSPISVKRNSATIWEEPARFLPRKSDDLRRQG